MQLRLGHVLALVASSPAAAAALMREHDGAFGTRPYFRTAEILTYGFQDLVFAPHSEHWRHVRRLCSAHVLSAVRSHSFDGMREREVAALVRTMRERAGGVVDMSKALYGFANGVICRAVSGTGRGLSREEEEEEEEEEGRRSELFRALIEVNTALLGGFCVGDYFPSLAWMDDALSGAGARAWRNLKRWDDLLEKVVQEHEARRRRRGDGDVEVEEEDFVDVLLAVVLQAEEKQDHDGGFELTSDAIKSLLVRNPAAMERLKSELRAAPPGSTTVAGRGDALGATTTPYLRAVVKETLRLHPPVPLLLPRECMRDTTVLGFPRGPWHPVRLFDWALPGGAAPGTSTCRTRPGLPRPGGCPSSQF
ncbi:indole-2-monooxygenase [Sorghum bicolor]|uniref:indole-2-monooxygenase n=1 Tax=Sorghum bicolor TaxID=4558 RepID=UPI000B4247AC|nr:indole-2-monooxygenase [Sorghum bicolor]|eukprot:XP_021311911.1 indole-2-monooxygenase [Sorghum bicolor]